LDFASSFIFFIANLSATAGLQKREITTLYLSDETFAPPAFLAIGAMLLNQPVCIVISLSVRVLLLQFGFQIYNSRKEIDSNRSIQTDISRLGDIFLARGGDGSRRHVLSLNKRLHEASKAYIHMALISFIPI
jgi:hypothetical protein